MVFYRHIIPTGKNKASFHLISSSLLHSKMLLDLLEDLVRCLLGVDLLDEALRPEVLDDGHRGVDVGVEALLQGLQVVVGAAGAGGAAAQATVHARLLVAHEEQDELQVHLC